MKKSMKRKPDIRLIIGSLGLLIIIIYALLMMTGYQTESRNNRNTNNREVDGYYIFSTLLKRLGYNTHSMSNPAEAFMHSGVLVCLDYNPRNRLLQEKRFEEWLKNGNTLFLLGLDTENTPLTRIPVEFSAPEPVKVKEPVGRDVVALSFKTGRYFSSPEKAEVLLETSKGAVLTFEKREEGSLFLLTDSSLFTNRYMQEENVAVLTNNLFSRYYNEEIYIYEQQEIYTTMPNPVIILFKGNLLFFTLHLLLMTAFFFYWKGKRFGNAVIYRPYARRTISDHTIAVGEFYFRVKANNLVDSLEVDYFLHKIHKILGEQKNLSKDELGRILTEHYGVDDKEFADLTAKKLELTTEMLFSRRDARSRILQNTGRCNYGK